MTAEIQQQSNEFEVNGEIFSVSEESLWWGKTKALYNVLNSNWTVNKEYLAVEEKDIATAWDWKRTEKVEWENWLWKWDYAAEINANYFKFLNDLGIETAFIKKLNSNTSLVKKLNMIPVECVYRFVETGSYTNRQEYMAKNDENYQANPDWTVLDKILIELFYKDDVEDEKWEIISDPLIQLDSEGIPETDINWYLVLLYPKTGEIIVYRKDIETEKMKSQMKYIVDNSQVLIDKTRETGLWVKLLGDKVWLSTLDWKVEFWIDSKGNILLWDSIDADSNRIREVFTVLWEDGKHYLAKDFNSKERVEIVHIFEQMNKEAKDQWKEEVIDIDFFRGIALVLPENIRVKELWIVVWLDKDWFRAWGTPWEYLEKVKRLANESGKALIIHNQEVWLELNTILSTVEEILDQDNVVKFTQKINNNITDIIGRKAV